MYPIKQIIALLLSLVEILFPFAVDVATNSGESLMYDWSAEDEFGEEHYTTLEKTPGEDFKILNLTDIQLYDSELYDEDGMIRESLALVSKLIETEKPDLITLSGDCFCSTLATIELIKLLESYGIPWAPVFGNHDGGNVGEWKFWAAWRLYRAEHSLFEFGPKDMGYGNYVINITENGKTVHSLYILDTHVMRDYEVKGDTVLGYDNLWDNQVGWYEWAVRGNERLSGEVVPSTVVMHIPPREFLYAWLKIADKERSADSPIGNMKPEYYPEAFGHSGEYGGYPPVENGFFDKIKELGSTKNVIAGHDHLNDYSVVYEGVRLTYALHTGFGGYYRDDATGGTVMTVSSDGEMTTHHVYYAHENGEWIAK